MNFVILYTISFAFPMIAMAAVGSCPPAMSVSVCDATCGPAMPCSSPQLCCPTTCGGSKCVDPMTQRRLRTYVKAGKCPSRPGGAWVCSHSCTGDSDCLRQHKCCKNRCNAHTCMQPESALNLV